MLISRKIPILLILLILPLWSACDADRETTDPTFRQTVEEQRVQAFVDAARQGHTGKIQLFLETQLGENQKILNAALLAAADANHLEISITLLDHGADPNTADPGGFTVLMEAALRGNLELVQQLLLRGAVGQFDLGPAAAFSVVYFLVVLLLCWIFYTSVVRKRNTDDV